MLFLIFLCIKVPLFPPWKGITLLLKLYVSYLSMLIDLVKSLLWLASSASCSGLPLYTFLKYCKHWAGTAGVMVTPGCLVSWFFLALLPCFDGTISILRKNTDLGRWSSKYALGDWPEFLHWAPTSPSPSSGHIWDVLDLGVVSGIPPCFLLWTGLVVMSITPSIPFLSCLDYP